MQDNVIQCVAVCCSVLLYVAVCCSVLQCTGPAKSETGHTDNAINVCSDSFMRDMSHPKARHWSISY